MFTDRRMHKKARQYGNSTFKLPMGPFSNLYVQVLPLFALSVYL